MVERAWVPDRGELVWLRFDPQAGAEQAGRRPALVVSPALYNGKVGLALFVPVTTREKGYPFEVRLPDGMQTTGVILSDHLKSLDWRAREAVFIERVPERVLDEVMARLSTLLT